MAKSIMQDRKVCYITGLARGLHKHHIYFGNGLRRVSEDNGFWVWLVGALHNLSDAGVHFDRALDLRLKRECQRKYEETHSREEFMELVGRSYL